jgi:hypothetical protein
MPSVGACAAVSPKTQRATNDGGSSGGGGGGGGIGGRGSGLQEEGMEEEQTRKMLIRKISRLRKATLEMQQEADTFR